MSDGDDLQREWAKQTNRRCWELLGHAQRSPDDERELLEAAYASAWHWRHCGTALNEQRAEWLISRVHAVQQRGKAAMRHVRRCLEITEAADLKDFDRAYAYEAMYRAARVTGDLDASGEWFTRAKAAAAEIADDEDRELFLSDLNS